MSLSGFKGFQCTIYRQAANAAWLHTNIIFTSRYTRCVQQHLLLNRLSMGDLHEILLQAFSSVPKGETRD